MAKQTIFLERPVFFVFICQCSLTEKLILHPFQTKLILTHIEVLWIDIGAYYYGSLYYGTQEDMEDSHLFAGWDLEGLR